MPCDRLRDTPEGPTQEHAAKRLAAIGDRTPPEDPSYLARARAARLASYPLGVLFAQHDISGSEHGAGCRYAMLFSRAVRPLTQPSILGSLIVTGGMPLALAAIDDVEERGAEDRLAYLARAVLGRRGSSVARAVDDTVIYERPPLTQKRLALIRDGLDALKDHFEREDERRQATMASGR